MKSPAKRDLLILIGNVIDHFDTSLYTYLAPILAPLFFPSEDPIVGLIAAYSIFATSIVTRPLGIYIFSFIARNKGGAKALSLSLTGVGIFTILIGMLPDYTVLGIFTPIIFVFLHSSREIFSSGEVAVAGIYILEDQEGKAAFQRSYLFQASTMLGIILASIAATITYYADYKDFWRFFYFLGGSVASVGYLLRKNLLKERADKKIPRIYYNKLHGFKILFNNKLNLFRVGIVGGLSYVTYLAAFVILDRLVPMISNIDVKYAVTMNNLMLFVDLILIFLIGSVISGYSSKKVMQTASGVLMLAIIPLFYFLKDASIYYVMFVKLFIILWGIIYMCPLKLWLKEQIQGEDKYIVIGFGSALGNSIIGKMSPSICLAIFHYTGNIILVAAYLAGIFATAYFVIRDHS